MASDAVAGLRPTERNNFVLMVSELVSNAIRHAPPEPDGRIVLKLDVDDATARAAEPEACATHLPVTSQHPSVGKISTDGWKPIDP